MDYGWRRFFSFFLSLVEPKFVCGMVAKSSSVFVFVCGIVACVLGKNKTFA